MLSAITGLPATSVTELPRPGFSDEDPAATEGGLAEAEGPGEGEDWEVAEGEEIDLAEAFADFSLPATAPSPAAAGAVDITAIEIPRETREPPTPPPHPSRQWVQVATGQDTAAFRFDWRRITRNAHGLLDGREAYIARWGQTNRLLTGPFQNAREAQQLVGALGEAGIDAFRFTSAAGEEVTSLD